MDKKVLLGVTGSIAAYKACELCRLLAKKGIEVQVVMTGHACELVGPATFRSLSARPVALDLFEEPSAAVHHIELA
ncbi:MAG: phosphopantothenoylcysteine decarboxylase, partial [Actinomycetia bacterium]|nr:phosphopantothenoylcysteine decarboxylase [Actinomycetes bacterium]